jgi:internalin A
VAKLENLIFLSLKQTQVTDTSLNELAKLQELLVLDLERTKVTKAGVAQLRKALGPNCSIYSDPEK